MEKERKSKVHCENCNRAISEENIDRVCASYVDILTEVSRHGYKGCPTCNCCGNCREQCLEES